LLCRFPAFGSDHGSVGSSAELPIECVVWHDLSPDLWQIKIFEQGQINLLKVFGN
jgi:hypothetical protein